MTFSQGANSGVCARERDPGAIRLLIRWTMADGSACQFNLSGQISYALRAGFQRYAAWLARRIDQRLHGYCVSLAFWSRGRLDQFGAVGSADSLRRHLTFNKILGFSAFRLLRCCLSICAVSGFAVDVWRISNFQRQFCAHSLSASGRPMNWRDQRLNGINRDDAPLPGGDPDG